MQVRQEPIHADETQQVNLFRISWFFRSTEEIFAMFVSIAFLVEAYRDTAKGKREGGFWFINISECYMGVYAYFWISTLTERNEQNSRVICVKIGLHHGATREPNFVVPFFSFCYF